MRNKIDLRELELEVIHTGSEAIRFAIDNGYREALRRMEELGEEIDIESFMEDVFSSVNTADKIHFTMMNELAEEYEVYYITSMRNK